MKSFVVTDIAFLSQNTALRTKFSLVANFHFHICLHFEIMAI